MAGSAVWVDVLPGMSKFGPELIKEAASAGASAGAAAGKSFDDGMATEASRGAGVKKILGDVASGAGKALGVISAGVVAVGGTIAGIAAKKGIDRLLDIDDAQSKLKGLGHDVNGIATIMDSALASVKGTAFGLGDAATVAASAVAAGIKPGQDLTKYLSLTADAATIAGVSLSEMGAIINKTTSTGKVYTDNLNQLADRGIPIFQWLQEEYGVSAEGLSKMVKEGKVDAETFRRVIEENIGGAALASGQSVRGAWANVGAALGRLGAMFLKGGVAGAPVLFASITGAVDRGAAALAPYADALGVKVVGGLTAVAAWIDRIDFGKVVDGVAGLYDLVVKGDFTGKLTNAFGIQEDAPVVDVILTVRDALSELFTAIGQGDLEGVKTALSGIAEAGGPLSTFLGGAAGGFGEIASSVGDLFVAGLPLLPALIDSAAQVVGFLADNSNLLLPILIALAAGFVLYRTSQVAANAAMVAGLPLRAAATIADVARTVALNNSTKATLLQMGIERASIGTRIAATGSIVAATVSTNLFAGAATRGAAASGIMAVGARILGGAMSFALGPVGLIITAVGLLIAGLVWAYQNVEWFRDIVNGALAGVMVAVQALGAAAVWLWENALQPAWTAIATAATWLYETILRPAFDGIALAVMAVGAAVQLYIGFWVGIFQAVAAAATWLWLTILAPAFAGIGAVVSWVGNTIFAIFDLVAHILIYVVGAAVTWLWESVISPTFTLIGLLIDVWWNQIVLPIFTAVVSWVRDKLGAIFTWLWGSIISPVFGWIGEKFAMFQLGAQIIFAAVGAFVQDKLAPIFQWLYETIIRPVFDGISSVISTVWTFGIKPIFDALAGFVQDTLPKAFETGRDAIGKAWDGLKDLAKAPIRFVVDTIINDGLIKNFNKLADFFGSTKIDEIKLPEGFRSGGILPGTSSMRDGDDQLVPMRRGEGVLVSEGLRTAADRQAFMAANAAGRRGVGFASLLGGGYADGGIVGNAIDWVRDTAGAAGKFISDPAGSLGGIVDGLVAKIPGGDGMVSLAKSAVSSLVGKAVEAIKGIGEKAMSVAGAPGMNGRLPEGLLAKVASFSGGPGVGSMGGYLRRDAAAALAAAESAKGSAITVTEGYRDLAGQQMRWNAYQAGRGNLAAAPGTSNHGLGLAADINGSAQSWLAKNGPAYGWYPTGLGFSQREPWHFDYKGKGGNGSTGMYEGGVVGMTPTLYDDGGLLNQGVSLIRNESKKPEYALPEDKLVDIVERASSRGGDEPSLQVVLQSKGDNLRDDIDEVNHWIRTKRRGGR